MEKTTPPPDYLSVGQFAARLGVSKALAYRLIADGRVPHLRLSERSIRIPTSALAAVPGRADDVR